MQNTTAQNAPAVVVVGSLHYDIMVQAPHRPTKGETVTGSAWFPKFGGKGGNQAVAAAGAGVKTRMIGAVGRDNFADFLLNHLTTAGIATDRIARVDVGSGMSVATLDAEGDYGAVIVSGANLLIDPAALEDDSLWDSAAVLILQNEVPEAVNIAAAKQARSRGVTVCLNAAPMREMATEFTDLVDILIVNAVEAEQLSGHAVPNLDAALTASRALTQRFDSVVTTAGSNGVALADRTGLAKTYAALDVTLISTHGAGDVFVGTFCAALAQGDVAEQAAEFANAAAARHVSTKTG